MKTNPYPYFVFQLWAEAAAWDYIAQDDCVNWSQLRRKITRAFCGIALDVLGKFWGWR
jgi:hypothetical protein